MAVTEMDVVMGWSGPVLPIGRYAGNLDRRRFANVSWPTLPLTLADNHQGTEFVGPIDSMEVLTVDQIAERVPLSDQDREQIGTEALWASGRFSPTEEGFKAAAQLAFWGRLPVSVEVRDGDYTEVPIENDDGEIVGVEMDWSRTVVGAVALERLPAFAGAWIGPDAAAAGFMPSDEIPVDDDDMEPVEIEDDLSAHLAEMTEVAARQAAVGPEPYPARFFTRLDYDQPTRLTISPEGEVTGHVAVWGRRYRQQGGGHWVAARCGDLSEWLVGAAPLDDGRIVPAGVIVSDALHQWGPQDAASMRRQVEDTSRQVMQVTAWEDRHGLAVHGSTLPGISPQDAARAMAGCPSIVTMDQKDGRGHLPVAVLCVNTCGLKPGDAVVTVEDGAPKTRVLAASTAGEPVAESCGCGGTCGGCGADWVAIGHDPETGSLTYPVRAASTEDPPKVVDLRSLEQIDADWRRARLKAATAPKPSGPKKADEG